MGSKRARMLPEITKTSFSFKDDATLFNLSHFRSTCNLKNYSNTPLAVGLILLKVAGG